MQRSRNILLILLFSLIVWGGQFPTVQGCAFEPGYFEYQTIFFQSSLAKDPVFERFYFDEQHERGEYDWDEAVIATRANENLKEWQKYFSGALGTNEIRQLVYETPLDDLKQLAAAGQRKNKTWEVILLQPEHRQALEYLIFAKRCEPFCTVDRWSWEIEAEIAKRRQPEAMRQLIAEGKALYTNSKSVFFKQRYGYQLVRLAHYSQDYQLSVDLFDQYIAPLSKNSIVWDWALRHKLGALFALEKNAEALVGTSLMFDQNPKMIDEAYLDYYTPEEPVWQESLRRAGHPHRQATLWMLRGLKEPRFILEPLQKMAELEPQSSRVEVMLVRYINRLECEFFNSAYFFGNHASHLTEEKLNGLTYSRELLNWITSVDKTRFRQPALWYTAGAYLMMIDRKHTEARGYLSKAASLGVLKSSDLYAQIQFLKLLNTVIEQPVVTPEIENTSIAVLRWLDAYPGHHNNRERIHHAFYTLLGQKYLIHKDFPKAYSCMAKARSEHDYLLELYPTTIEMDRLIALLTKTQKTPFEQMITTGLPWSVNDYLSIQGTQLLRKGKYPDAVTRFRKISKPYWDQLRKDDRDLVETSFELNYYNPRTGLYKYPKGGFPRFTKLEFTQNIIALEKQALKDPANAGKYYYQIANGFFHSPFWGFNEQLWPYSSSVWYGGDSYPFDIHGISDILKRQHAVFDQEYGERKVALSYYVKAMNATRDPELAAKCCFLAAACMTEFSFYHQFQEPGKGMAYYFDMLRKKYSQTAYYQKVIRECATLQDYLKKH